MSPVSSVLVGKRVVIVEDEGITLMQLQRILTQAGLLVVGRATHGEEAIKIILREKPDLVTMDLTLQGMDGIEATRRVLEEFQTCVVIMSAYREDLLQQESGVAGACGYIVKPFTAANLLPELEAYYEKSQIERHEVASTDR